MMSRITHYKINMSKAGVVITIVLVILMMFGRIFAYSYTCSDDQKFMRSILEFYSDIFQYTDINELFFR